MPVVVHKDLRSPQSESCFREEEKSSVSTLLANDGMLMWGSGDLHCLVRLIIAFNNSPKDRREVVG